MNAPKRISARAALAATLGLDLAELSGYRYQSTRTPFAVYAVGEWYFTTSPEKPAWKMKFEDGDWSEHTDRHFAQQAGTRIWQLRTVTSTRSAECARLQAEDRAEEPRKRAEEAQQLEKRLAVVRGVARGILVNSLFSQLLVARAAIDPKTAIEIAFRLSFEAGEAVADEAVREGVIRRAFPELHCAAGAAALKGSPT